VALCHVGLVLRDAKWNSRPVRVGGIGGVKTHPAVRGRGFASTAIRLARDFFCNQGNVDFLLLVCEPHLVAFYERFGWRSFPGELLVAQRNRAVHLQLVHDRAAGNR
jgi:predicted GNAT family acetyltransferase